MQGLTVTRREMVKTPFGAPSCPLVYGELDGKPVVFLARHGSKHRIPPHRVNYCANIWALHSVGVKHIIAVAAVGGIHSECSVGSIVIPDQIIDYTNGRVNTFFDGGDEPVEHIDFSYPYSEALRTALIASAKEVNGVQVVEDGVYGATQGPRLETAAEIRRMANDGCTVVGMTGMPEASLAAELGVAYACLGVVINAAAGTDGKAINTDELPAAISAGMDSARSILNSVIANTNFSIS